MRSSEDPARDFSTTFSVDQAPGEAFAAVNNVRGWWGTDIEGSTDSLGEFTYRHGDMHQCTIRVSELVPAERVAWLVLDYFFDFTEDKTEWNDTEIRFEISRRNHTTELTFAHLGLVPDDEFCDVCSNAWGFYVNTSLRGLIRAGQGLPNQGR
jgi:hypothetical protein